MDRDQVEDLVNAITSIAHGGMCNVSGLEMLSIAMAGECVVPGEGASISVRQAIDDSGDRVGESIEIAGNNISDAIKELARAISGLGQRYSYAQERN